MQRTKATFSFIQHVFKELLHIQQCEKTYLKLLLLSKMLLKLNKYASTADLPDFLPESCHHLHKHHVDSF